MSPNNCTSVVNLREDRGLRIASRYTLKPTNGVWRVPSESDNDPYRVDPEAGRCTCPDSEIRRVKCKHQWAVEIAMQRETVQTVEMTQHPDGTTSTTARKTTRTIKTARVTYKQDWPAYNAAQTAEKSTFLTLLHELCGGIQEPAQPAGRKRLPLADMVFAAAFKVYSGFSARRFMSDVADAHEHCYLTRIPHFNSILNYLELPSLTTRSATRPDHRAGDGPPRRRPSAPGRPRGRGATAPGRARWPGSPRRSVRHSAG